MWKEEDYSNTTQNTPRTQSGGDSQESQATLPAATDSGTVLPETGIAHSPYYIMLLTSCLTTPEEAGEGQS